MPYYNNQVQLQGSNTYDSNNGIIEDNNVNIMDVSNKHIENMSEIDDCKDYSGDINVHNTHNNNISHNNNDRLPYTQEPNINYNTIEPVQQQTQHYPMGSPTSQPINTSSSGNLAHLMMQDYALHLDDNSNNNTTANTGNTIPTLQQSIIDAQLELAAREDAAYFAQIESLDLVIDLDSFFMQCAIADGRVTPINIYDNYNGCVIADVENNSIVCSAHSCEYDGKMHAIHAALHKLSLMNISHNQRTSYTLYATCEPCNECAEYIINSNIKRVILGVDEQYSDVNSHIIYYNIQSNNIDLRFMPAFSHQNDETTSDDDSDMLHNNNIYVHSSDICKHDDNNISSDNDDYVIDTTTMIDDDIDVDDDDIDETSTDSDNVFTHHLQQHPQHAQQQQCNTNIHNNNNTQSHIKYIDDILFRAQQRQQRSMNNDSNDRGNTDSDGDLTEIEQTNLHRSSSHNSNIIEAQ